MPADPSVPWEDLLIPIYRKFVACKPRNWLSWPATIVDPVAPASQVGVAIKPPSEGCKTRQGVLYLMYDSVDPDSALGNLDGGERLRQPHDGCPCADRRSMQ